MLLEHLQKRNLKEPEIVVTFVNNCDSSPLEKKKVVWDTFGILILQKQTEPT